MLENSIYYIYICVEIETMKKKKVKAGRKSHYKVAPKQIAVRVISEKDKREIKALEHKLLSEHKIS